MLTPSECEKLYKEKVKWQGPGTGPWTLLSFDYQTHRCGSQSVMLEFRQASATIQLAWAGTSSTFSTFLSQLGFKPYELRRSGGQSESSN